MITTISRDVVSALGTSVRATRLPELLGSYYKCRDEFPESGLAQHLSLVDDPLAAAVELLTLYQPVAATRLEPFLLDDAKATLTEMGLLVEKDGFVQMPGHRLVNHFGALIFIERPKIDIRFYYGADSVSLGRFLTPSHGRVLDLCAGIGTQGVTAALTADSVVSVEKQGSVATLYHLNAALNGVDSKMELRIGDFLEPVRGERFDRVCCNPPLLPMPEDLPYPMVGDGGPDGLGFAARLLQALPDLLEDGGQCCLVGTILGDGSRPDVSSFETIARERGLDIFLIVPCRMEMAAGKSMFEGLVHTAAEFGGLEVKKARKIYWDHFQSMGRDHLYSFVLFASRASAPSAAGVRVTRHYERSRALWAL